MNSLHRLYIRLGLVPIMLVVLVVIFALVVPHFLALPNILNVLRSSSYLVILAVGQMLVLMVGGFDLSVGAVVALTSVSSALVMAGLKDDMADAPGLIILAGVAAGLGCGFAVGLVNGLCVAFLRVSPFMVSLGTASIATGIALSLTNGIPIYGMPVEYVEGFGRALWFALPPAVYLAVALVALVFILQNYTYLGRYIVAIGGNLQAAVVSGVRTRLYIVSAYVLCSVFASISGLALTAQIGSGQAAINSQLTLESIAAAVIAGVSLKGGVGRAEQVALGAVFLLLLTNAMDLLTIDPRIQTVFLGVIVVMAGALDELSKRRRTLA